MNRRYSLVFLFLVACASGGFCQGESPARSLFRQSLRRTSDSLVAVGSAYADSLLKRGDASASRAIILLGNCIDSLVSGAGDSLDSPARARLSTTGLSMRTTLGVMGFPVRLAVRSLLRSLGNDLPVLLERRSACRGCAAPSDFAAEKRAFASEADSATVFYADSMARLEESWEAALDDSVVAFTDSMTDMIGTLTAGFARNEEDAPVSRLVATGEFQPHSNYRGRDNGVPESVFGPTLAYHHKSGFFASGSVDWVSRPSPGPDDVNLGCGYEVDITPSFGASFSYTHYWYSDSSTSPRAATNQSLEVALTLDPGPVSLAGSLTYDFGGGSGGAEFTTSLDVSRDLVVPGRTLGGTLVLSPALGATWGDQDERLLEKRLERVKKKVVVVRSRMPEVIFGIMDYEFSFPGRLQWGRFSAEPAFQYIVPADVLNSGRTLLNKDPSTAVPFASFSLTLTMIME